MKGHALLLLLGSVVLSGLQLVVMLDSLVLLQERIGVKGHGAIPARKLLVLAGTKIAGSSMILLDVQNGRKSIDGNKAAGGHDYRKKFF